MTDRKKDFAYTGHYDVTLTLVIFNKNASSIQAFESIW